MLPVSQRFTDADKKYAGALELLTQGKVSAAVELLEEIVLEFDNYGKAWCELGNILQYRLSDAESATEYYRKAMDVLPSYAPAYLGYADALFSLEKYAEVNAVLNQAIEIKGSRKDIALLRSALLMESQGRFEDAIETYKEALLASFSDEEITRCENGINRCVLKKKYSK